MPSRNKKYTSAPPRGSATESGLRGTITTNNNSEHETDDHSISLDVTGHSTDLKDLEKTSPPGTTTTASSSSSSSSTTRPSESRFHVSGQKRELRTIVHNKKNSNPQISDAGGDDSNNSLDFAEDNDFDVRAATSRDGGRDVMGAAGGGGYGYGSKPRRSRGSIWKQRQNDKVDQRINLMDTDAAQYSFANLGIKRKSMDDMFLGDGKDSDAGSSQHFMDSFSRFEYLNGKGGFWTKCKYRCCNCDNGKWKKWLLLFLVLFALTIGALLSIPISGAVSNMSENTGPENNEAVTAPESQTEETEEEEEPTTTVQEAEEDLDLEPEKEEGKEDFVLDVSNNNNDENQGDNEPSVLDLIARDEPVAVLPPSDIGTSNIPRTSRSDAIKFIVLDQDVTEATEFDNFDSPASEALEWISTDDSAQLKIPGYDAFDNSDDMVAAKNELLQRYALAVFYFSMQGEHEGAGEGQRMLRGDKLLRRLRDKTEKEVDNRESFDMKWTRSVSVCQWPGISCNGNEEVTDINVTQSLLGGRLPREIFRGSGLPQLTTLDLSYNQISGYLPYVGRSVTHPSEINVAPPQNNLKYLFLQHNLIRGPIDPIMDMRELVYLDFTSNEFTDDIPQDMAARLQNLERIHLATNDIDGLLPTKLSSMTRLVSLDLEGNSLSGTIPTAWSRLTNLEVLNLAHNEGLKGTVPAALQDMKKMKYLSLQKTGLKGTVPDFLGELTNLEGLYLHNTDLTGSMPTAVCDLGLKDLTSDCSELGQFTCSCCTDCFWR